jgi:hypothetical protein
MSPRAVKSQVEPAPPTRRLEMGLAVGCVFLATVLWLAFRAETLSEQQFEILRIVLALAGGGVGAVIPGFLDVSMRLARNGRCGLAAGWRCSWSCISGPRLIGSLRTKGQ